MGSSAKPRRRRAAASALPYERQRGRPSAAKRKEKTKEEKGEYAFGCLIFLLIAGLVVLMATLDWLWGDDTWQWAAETWPGGAYGFAVCVGVGGPCLATLAVFSLGSVGWKSWQQHKFRSLSCAALGIASTAALMPYLVLVFNAQNTGKWGRGRSIPPSWVFSNYPWLWAVGLISTIATIVLLVWYFIAHDRRRRGAAEPALPEAPPPSKRGS